MHDTLRFRAFAAELGVHPERAPVSQYITWIGTRWAEFNRDRMFNTKNSQADFDAWLSKKYGVTA